MREVTQLLHVPIDRITPASFLQRVEHFMTDGQTHIVLYANAHCVNEARRDRCYHKILQEADVVCADGMGVVWGSRLTSTPLPERVNVGDMVQSVCRMAAEKKYRLFFLGGAPGVAERAARQLRETCPRLQIVGTRDGYASAEHDAEIIAQINQARPHLLLVGMGVPKQEKWIWQHRRALQVPVLWGVGAAFEYYAGQRPRAPGWMRRSGLEWCFRLLLEPKRLWRRYLIGNALFLLRTCALLLTDAVLIILAWFGAYAMRYRLNEIFGVDINPIHPYLAVVPLVVGTWLTVCAGVGLYRRSAAMSIAEELRSIAGATCLGFLLTVACAFLLKELSLGRSVALFMAAIMAAVLTVSHLVYRTMEQRRNRRHAAVRSALIVGTGRFAREVKAELEAASVEYEVLGFLRDGGPDEDIEPGHIVGGLTELSDAVRQRRVQDVFVASTRLSWHEQLNLLSRVERDAVDFHIVSDRCGSMASRVPIGRLADVPIFDLPRVASKHGYRAMKRCLDVLVSGASLAALLPLLGLIALIIKLELRGPALFTQLRIGRHGRPFRMYKFRTMFAEAAAYEEAPNDLTDPRVTRFGRFLRRWSLDELPQLLNVMNGDMSLVGPRPEMPFLVKRYEPWQRHRHAVRPGLTGLWQIVGRKHLPLHQHLEYDLYYVRHRGWWLDATILLRTIPAVLHRRGAF